MPLTSEEKNNLISDLRFIKLADYDCATHSYNMGIEDSIKEIQAMPEQAENTQALIKLRDHIKQWWDRLYPERIFPKEIEGVDNEDRDEGVMDVVEIRELIKATEKPRAKGLKGYHDVDEFYKE